MYKFIDKEYEVYTSPLTDEQMQGMADENNIIAGVIKLEISEMIDNDLEGFLDILSEKLTGSVCLMEIGYKVVGCTEDECVLMRVSGDISEVIEDNE